jgi:hypothetical protein
VPSKKKKKKKGKWEEEEKKTLYKDTPFIGVFNSKFLLVMIWYLLTCLTHMKPGSTCFAMLILHVNILLCTLQPGIVFLNTALNLQSHLSTVWQS